MNASSLPSLPLRLFPRAFSAAALLLLSAFTLASQASERVALVIGNDAYQYVSPLAEAKNDARRIGGTLESIGFFVEYLLDATWKNKKETIERFAVENADAELAVVYFAGHGVEVDGEHFLVPIDCKPTSESSFQYNAVALGYLLNQLADHQNCLRVVILDACRNNPFENANRSLGRSSGLGARTKPAPKQTLIAYSANTGQTAIDGMYTPALLKHLKNPKLRGEEVFYAINNEVSDATEGRQEPAIYITGGRPFSFHSDSGNIPATASTGGSTGSTATGGSTPSTPSSTGGRPSSGSGSTTATPSTPPPAPDMQVSKQEIQNFLDNWIAAWESRDINRYSRHYGRYFAGSSYSHVSGHKSMTRRTWMNDKAEKFGKARAIDVAYNNASYQTDGETVILKFQQDFFTQYQQSHYKDTGVKVLLLRREDGRLRIVNEKFFPPEVAHQGESSGGSGLYSVVSTFVHDWAAAWESRSIDRYAKFYDRSFQGKKGSRYLDYNAWMDDMASKFRSASHISVGLSDLDIQQTGDRFTVEYKQTYKASNYSDVGYKKLTLIRDANDNLKIVGESWRGL